MSCRLAGRTGRPWIGGRHARRQTQADHRTARTARSVTAEDGCALRDLDQVRQVVAQTCFPAGPRAGPGPGRVGLEVETFPLLPGRAAARRVPLDQLVGLLDRCVTEVPGLGPRDPAAPTPCYPLSAGGTLGFEPGGQLEHSTAAHATATGALADADRLEAALPAPPRRRGVAPAP